MAKLMGACGRGMDAGALERMPNDRPNATGPAESRGSGLWRVEIRGDWCCAVGHRAGTRRSPCRPPWVRATRAAAPLCRARSTVRRSSQCHRVREMPLHLNATPVVRAGARWRSRDAPSRCADRCWPAADGLDPPQSLGGSTSSTSWPRPERRRPNPA